MSDPYERGLALGSAITTGVAQWRQLQMERQQTKEFEGGIALYNQRSMAARQATNAEPDRLLTAYKKQWERYPDADVVQRPTSEVGEDGQVVTEPVVRTPEGDIPLNQIGQLKAAKMQNEIGVTMADLDALMELQARYPENAKVRQFVATQSAQINAKWQLKLKAQEQNSLEQARGQAAFQFQQEQQLRQERLALEREQFEAAPQRAEAQQRSEADEGIRRDRARISAQKEADIEVEGVKQRGQAGKPPTEVQSKAATFGRRVEQALGEFESIDYDRAALSAGAESMLPNVAKSGPLQRIEQAERNFLLAVLRKESGALISPSEISEGTKQYFPRAGDKPETVQQKARNRQLAFQALKGESGNAWGMVPQGATGGLSSEEQALLAAVKAGKMTPAEARARRAQLRGQ